MIDTTILTQRTQQLADKWHASGALSIIEHTTLVFDECCGYQNSEDNIKTTSDTTYCIPTRSEKLVAIAIMQLAEKQLLSLDDTIDRFIPEYSQAAKVKIIHLLQQNSGIIDYFFGVQTKNLCEDEKHTSLPFVEQFVREKQLFAKGLIFAEVLALIDTIPLEFEPGSKASEYSCSDAVFLAEIITRVSGQDLFEYMQDNIFKPLCMDGITRGNTTHGISYGCYEDTKLAALPAVDSDYVFTATQSDLVKLGQGILAGKLLNKSSWKRCKRFNKWNESFCFELDNGWYRFTLSGYLGYSTDMLLQYDKDIVCVATLSCDGIFEMQDNVWHWFKGDFSDMLNSAATFPTKVKIVPLTNKNVWDTATMTVSEHQKAFVWAPALAIACTSVRPYHYRFVITDCGINIGLIILEANPKEDKYYINTVLIDQRYQRRGYGKLMVSWGVEWLKKKGATELTIGVNRHNIAARRLYESVGFSIGKVYDEGCEMCMKLD